jgi:hypothetical protein
MKQTFCIILLFVTYLSYSQEYYDTDMTREKPKLRNYYLETTKLIDSTGGKPYVSSVQIFDAKGRHKIDYEFDRKGDTIEKIETKYPDKLTEIQIHSYKAFKSDTAIFKYNKRNQQTMEIWKWGEDKEIDTTKFFYDKEHRLIANFDIYGWDTYKDSLFYRNKKLIKSISYDWDTIHSVFYHYHKDKIINIKKYKKENELISDYQIEYGKYKKPKRIVNIYKNHNSKEFDKKTITVYEYHNKNQIKSKIIRRFTKGKLEETTELYYSKHGFLKESKTKNSEGKTIRANKITLHNTV